MDRNTTSVQIGKDCAPEKNRMELPDWKKIFQHGKESLRNKDSVSQYCNKKAAVSLILNENVSETLCIFSIDKTNCCRI